MGAHMTWKTDLNYGLAAFGIQIPERIALDEWIAKLGDKPAERTASVVAASSVLFLLAERGHNPKVHDIYDAMTYCSTCLSVGYHDIFPRTPVGKLIGTILMSIGPSLSSAVLDGESEKRAEQIQEETLTTLKQILSRLPEPQPA